MMNAQYCTGPDQEHWIDEDPVPVAAREVGLVEPGGRRLRGVRSIGEGSVRRAVLAEHVADWRVDLVVCSPAKRTTATAKPLLEVLGCPVRYDDSLYAAEVDDLLALTRRLPDDIGSVMLVGHNPSMEEFTALLSGASPRYPTGALGTLLLAIDHWHDVAPGCAELSALVTPAELTSM